jgi:hypothetical protein
VNYKWFGKKATVNEGNPQKHKTGQLVSGPRFQLRTYRIQSRRFNNSTTTFGKKSDERG